MYIKLVYIVYIYIYIHTKERSGVLKGWRGCAASAAETLQAPSNCWRQPRRWHPQRPPFASQVAFLIYIYTHTHTHTHIYTHTHTHTHRYIYIHTYIHTFVYIHILTDRGRAAHGRSHRCAGSRRRAACSRTRSSTRGGGNSGGGGAWR